MAWDSTRRRPDRKIDKTGPRSSREAVAIPGYRAGLEVVFNVERQSVVVEPGILVVKSATVRIQEPVDVVRGEAWLSHRNPCLSYYIYVSSSGTVHVDKIGPTYNAENFTDTHPVLQDMVAIGRIYVGDNSKILWAGSEYRTVATESVVAAFSYSGGGEDYRCDGRNDESEINAAIHYQLEVGLGGGVVRLTGGRFNCSGSVSGLGTEGILVGAGRSTVIYAPSLDNFRIQENVRDLVVVSGDTRDLYGPSGEILETVDETPVDPNPEQIISLDITERRKFISTGFGGWLKSKIIFYSLGRESSTQVNLVSGGVLFVSELLSRCDPASPGDTVKYRNTEAEVTAMRVVSVDRGGSGSFFFYFGRTSSGDLLIASDNASDDFLPLRLLRMG